MAAGTPGWSVEDGRAAGDGAPPHATADVGSDAMRTKQP